MEQNCLSGLCRCLFLVFSYCDFRIVETCLGIFVSSSSMVLTDIVYEVGEGC